jgi:DnaJ-class molecular chaperone
MDGKMDGNSTNKILDTTQNINIKKIPFKCVVCNGFGTLKFGSKTCQACKGKGYILVKQD